MGQHSNKPPQPAKEMADGDGTRRRNGNDTRTPEQQRPRMTDDGNTHTTAYLELFSWRSGLLSRTARWVGRAVLLCFGMGVGGERVVRMEVEVDTPPAYGE
jgi:hypothetical protein